VQEVVPLGKHVERAREIAQLIARQAPLGVQATLENARLAQSLGNEVAIEHLKAVLPDILKSEDAMEGVASFLQRRDAVFKGK